MIMATYNPDEISSSLDVLVHLAQNENTATMHTRRIQQYVTYLQTRLEQSQVREKQSAQTISKLTIRETEVFDEMTETINQGDKDLDDLRDAATTIIDQLKDALRPFVADTGNVADRSLLHLELPVEEEEEEEEEKEVEEEEEVVVGEEQERKTEPVDNTPSTPTNNTVADPPTPLSDVKKIANILKARAKLNKSASLKSKKTNTASRIQPLINAIRRNGTPEIETLISKFEKIFRPHTGVFNFTEELEKRESILKELRSILMNYVIEMDPKPAKNNFGEAMDIIAREKEAAEGETAALNDTEWLQGPLKNLVNAGELYLSGIVGDVEIFTQMANRTTETILSSLNKEIGILKLICHIAVCQDENDDYVLHIVDEAYNGGNKRVEKGGEVVDIDSDSDSDEAEKTEAEKKTEDAENDDGRINCGFGVEWLDVLLTRTVNNQKTGRKTLVETSKLLISILCCGNEISRSFKLSSNRMGMKTFLLAHGGTAFELSKTRSNSVQAVLAKAECHPKMYAARENKCFEKRRTDAMDMLDPLVALYKSTDTSIANLCKSLPWKHNDHLWRYWKKHA